MRINSTFAANFEENVGKCVLVKDVEDSKNASYVLGEDK